MDHDAAVSGPCDGRSTRPCGLTLAELERISGGDDFGGDFGGYDYGGYDYGGYDYGGYDASASAFGGYDASGYDAGASAFGASDAGSTDAGGADFGSFDAGSDYAPEPTYDAGSFGADATSSGSDPYDTTAYTDESGGFDEQALFDYESVTDDPMTDGAFGDDESIGAAPEGGTLDDAFDEDDQDVSSSAALDDGASVEPNDDVEEAFAEDPADGEEWSLAEDPEHAPLTEDTSPTRDVQAGDEAVSEEAEVTADETPDELRAAEDTSETDELHAAEDTSETDELHAAEDTSETDAVHAAEDISETDDALPALDDTRATDEAELGEYDADLAEHAAATPGETPLPSENDADVTQPSDAPEEEPDVLGGAQAEASPDEARFGADDPSAEAASTDDVPPGEAHDTAPAEPELAAKDDGRAVEAAPADEVPAHEPVPAEPTSSREPDRAVEAAPEGIVRTSGYDEDGNHVVTETQRDGSISHIIERPNNSRTETIWRAGGSVMQIDTAADRSMRFDEARPDGSHTTAYVNRDGTYTVHDRANGVDTISQYRSDDSATIERIDRNDGSNQTTLLGADNSQMTVTRDANGVTTEHRTPDGVSTVVHRDANGVETSLAENDGMGTRSQREGIETSLPSDGRQAMIDLARKVDGGGVVTEGEHARLKEIPNASSYTSPAELGVTVYKVERLTDGLLESSTRYERGLSSKDGAYTQHTFTGELKGALPLGPVTGTGSLGAETTMKTLADGTVEHQSQGIAKVGAERSLGPLGTASAGLEYGTQSGVRAVGGYESPGIRTGNGSTSFGVEGSFTPPTLNANAADRSFVEQILRRSRENSLAHGLGLDPTRGRVPLSPPR